jgi:trans-aconitate methyltransferase
MHMNSSPQTPPISTSWDAMLYQEQHHFVFEKGESLLSLLKPQSGERVLDLGCGTGQLTAKIAEAGADVIGVDNAASMLETASVNYPHIKFECRDAAELPYNAEFDAVFSNAALHWMKKNPQAVAKSVYSALKPGGRFVLEMGAKGNIDHVLEGIRQGLKALDFSDEAIESRNPWYFPSLAEYAMLLESAGLEVLNAVVFERPSPLSDPEQGLRHWITMFGNAFCQGLSPEELERMLSVAEEMLRPRLHQNGQWVADYRRLRILARKPVESVTSDDEAFP